MPTSIHWHGSGRPPIWTVFPALAFPASRPGETFTYRIPVKQNGTYWYHSHSRFQEQTGHYGPLVIEPRGKDPIQYDRDYAIMLSDWTDEDPETILSNLKQAERLLQLSPADGRNVLLRCQEEGTRSNRVRPPDVGPR